MLLDTGKGDSSLPADESSSATPVSSGQSLALHRNLEVAKRASRRCEEGKENLVVGGKDSEKRSREYQPETQLS